MTSDDQKMTSQQRAAKVFESIVECHQSKLASDENTTDPLPIDKAWATRIKKVRENGESQSDSDSKESNSVVVYYDESSEQQDRKAVDTKRSDDGDEPDKDQKEDEQEKQRKMYDTFCDQLRCMIHQLSNLTVSDVNIPFEYFQSLCASRGDGWMNNVRLSYQPQIIVLNNSRHVDTSSATPTEHADSGTGQPSTPHTAHQAQQPNLLDQADNVHFQNEEIFVYPNALIFMEEPPKVE